MIGSVCQAKERRDNQMLQLFLELSAICHATFEFILSHTARLSCRLLFGDGFPVRHEAKNMFETADHFITARGYN